MFHACDVKMRTMAAISEAIFTGTTALRPRRTTGRNDRIGTLCSTSRSGSRTRCALRCLAAA